MSRSPPYDATRAQSSSSVLADRLVAAALSRLHRTLVVVNAFISSALPRTPCCKLGITTTVS